MVDVEEVGVAERAEVVATDRQEEEDAAAFDHRETSPSSPDGSNTQCSSSTSFSGCWEVSLDMHEMSRNENATF